MPLSGQLRRLYGRAKLDRLARSAKIAFHYDHE